MNDARYVYVDGTDIIKKRMIGNLSTNSDTDTWLYDGEVRALNDALADELVVSAYPRGGWFNIIKGNVTIHLSQMHVSHFYNVNSWITNGDESKTKLSCKEFYQLFDNNDDFIGLPRRIPTKSARKVV